VVLPGKISSGIVATQGLSELLTQRLNQIWYSFRKEVEKALVFTTKGAAALAEGAGKQLDAEAKSYEIVEQLYANLVPIRKKIVKDIRAAYEGDPAALSFAEVQLAYPGLLAICSHRIAHELYKMNVPILPRVMSEWAHTETGVDIHPGATIGEAFFIDHATGVVIGETTVIGNKVKLYQGVTLGAKSFPLDDQGKPVKHVKRHPQVEDEVIIYANATILGGDTIIGRGAVIGANVFLAESVAAGATVRQKKADLEIVHSS